MLGCIADEGHAVIWVVYPTDAPPIARQMTAADARIVQQRYTRQQIELTEANAKAKRGETVDEATVREIVDRDLFAWTSAVVVEAFAAG